MTLSLTLPPEVETKLRLRAAQSGQSPDAYALRVLAAAVAAPDIDDLLAPLRREFAASGVSDEQLVEQTNEARDEYHAATTVPSARHRAACVVAGAVAEERVAGSVSPNAARTAAASSGR